MKPQKDLLIVENEENCLEVMCDICSDRGILADCVRTPKEAIEKAKENDYKVILTDWYFPKEYKSELSRFRADEYEEANRGPLLARRLRTLVKCPIVAMSCIPQETGSLFAEFINKADMESEQTIDYLIKKYIRK